ncbi:hypothetical protein Hanom_Chr03g00194401 [Helianthus anomalus]
MISIWRFPLTLKMLSHHRPFDRAQFFQFKAIPKCTEVMFCLKQNGPYKVRLKFRKAQSQMTRHTQTSNMPATPKPLKRAPKFE